MSCLIIIINTIAPVKGCLVLGPRTLILTSYLESAGLSWFHHTLSSICCDDVQTGSIVGTKNLKFLKIHSWLMEKSHYYLTSCKNLESSNFFHKVHTSFWVTQSQSASPVIGSLSLSQPSLFQKNCCKFILQQQCRAPNVTSLCFQVRGIPKFLVFRSYFAMRLSVVISLQLLKSHWQKFNTRGKELKRFQINDV